MNRGMVVLLLYLVLSTSLFGLSVYNYINNISMLDIGISAQMINMTIIFLSAVMVAKTAWHIFTF